MNTTRHKSVAPALPLEDDERYGAQTDAFIARNREALNRSLRGARREVAEGTISTKGIDTIIAEGKARKAKRS
jgi:hypothetical protein